MPIDPRPRAITRKPSSNPAWAELESVAVEYLALPPPPRSAVDEARRKELHKNFLRGLADGWVRMVADDVAGTASGTEPAQRPTSELEKVLRAEARKLALKHHSDALAEAHGGATNLAAVAAQQLMEGKLERYGRRQQTLLTGLLSEWDQSRGSLYTFISLAASTFLKDLHRQVFGDNRVRPDKEDGAKTRPLVVRPQVRARRVRPKADQRVEATPPEWLSAEAEAGKGDGKSADDWWDEQEDINRTGPAEESLEADETRRVLFEAVQALPEEMQLLFEYEMAKHEDDLSDEEIARRLGCNRATWRKRQDAMHRALRRSMGRALGE